MKQLLLITLTAILLQSCALIQMDTKHYKNDVGKAPREELLPFKDKQALGTAATANNNAAAKVYYEGTEPKSTDAKFLYDMSYRFMDFLGVDTSFDLTDPESVNKVFENADTALKAKDEINAKLEKELQDFQIRLEGEKKTSRDKAAEYEANSGKMTTRLGSMFWGWIWTIVIVFIAAIVLQIWTGIPMFTWMFKGGISALGMLKNGFKQTAAAVGDTLKELEETIKDEKATQAEKEEAKYWLDKLKENLRAKQDEIVKQHVVNIKKEIK